MTALEEAAEILQQRGTPAEIDRCDLALEFVRKIEGGLADLKGDRGRLTKFGISSTRFPDLDIRNLTWDDARVLYFAYYWLEASCQRCPYPIAVVLFDYGIHSDPSRAVKALQREIGTTPDGDFGANTAAALEAALNARDAVDVATSIVLRRVKFLVDGFRGGRFPLDWLHGYWRRLVLLEHELHRTMTDFK